MCNEFEKKLREKLKTSKLLLTEEQIRKTAIFYKELISWNKITNLTRITDEEDFITKNVIDSLMVENLIKIKPGAKIIDIGSGPGLPGIILKIKRPDFKIDLLESIKKKTTFLAHTTKKLDFLKTEVIRARAERVAKDEKFRENYDVAIARAVASLNKLLEICLPFVCLDGIFIAMKSENIADEVRDSKNAIEILGGKLEDIIDYDVEEGVSRKLVVIRKVKDTPKKYPRRPNAIKNNPL